jgi:hypothetical protein
VLAYYLGWLPDLQAKHRRVSTRVLPSDESYELYNADLSHHLYDNTKKLQGYQAGMYRTFTNRFYCQNKK